MSEANENHKKQPGDQQPVVPPDTSAGGEESPLADFFAADVPAVDETAELRRQLDESRDRSLRAQAELENYRKRMARQMEEEIRYAGLPLIRDLLPVWDNTLRAIEAAEKTAEAAKVLEGFKMVASQLERVLQQHNCVRIEALHKPFDPHRHEAITQQPSADYPPNTVVFVVRDGFQYHDRIVRPSQVIVSTGVPQATA